MTEETLNRDRQSFGIQDPLTLSSMQLLGEILEDEGDHAGAEKLIREGLEAERRAFGSEDTRTLNSMLVLGGLLDRKGQYHEAEQIVREAVDIERKIPGTDNFNRFRIRQLLFDLLSKEGKYAEAESVGRETVEMARRMDPHFVFPVAGLLYNLACVAARNREPNQALSFLRESIGKGFSDLPYMEKDPDLISLHSDPRFTALLKNNKALVSSIPSLPQ